MFKTAKKDSEKSWFSRHPVSTAGMATLGAAGLMGALRARKSTKIRVDRIGHKKPKPSFSRPSRSSSSKPPPRSSGGSSYKPPPRPGPRTGSSSRPPPSGSSGGRTSSGGSSSGPKTPPPGGSSGSGHKAPPPPPPPPKPAEHPEWLKGVKTKAEAKSRYREQAKKHHPDRGGDTRTMQDINAAWDKYQSHPDFSKLGHMLRSFSDELEKISFATGW